MEFHLRNMEADTVPPSSPPHATMSAPSGPNSPFFEPQYREFSPKSSSPPPLFSSDDSRESADIANYESPRIFKNKRKGAWWDNAEDARSTPESKKTKMSRNYDSGVYMMSDVTDSSDSLPVQHKSPFGFDGTCDEPPSPTPSVPAKPLMSEEEHVFCDKMYDGLEKNSETYDFSGCSLKDQDICRIGELASAIKNAPDPGNELPAEGQYRSMVPELYVSLKNNKLRYLTPSLFDVHTITSLVLADNEIEELPSEIGQLRNLVELNISNNKLQWLPFDILELYLPTAKLNIIGDSGVSWLQPNVAQIPGSREARQITDNVFKFMMSLPDPTTSTDLVPKQIQKYVDASPVRAQLLSYLRHKELDLEPFPLTDEYGMFPHHPVPAPGVPRYMARTLVSYFDEAGFLVKGSAKPANGNDDFVVMSETQRGAHGAPAVWFEPEEAKKTTSLATMCLHTALRHKDQEDMSLSDLRHLIGEPLPLIAAGVLEEAEHNTKGGFGTFKKCHTCKREYVLARAEWVEWWCSRGSEKTLPFKVKVCSWACVPEGMRKRPKKELEWQ